MIKTILGSLIGLSITIHTAFPASVTVSGAADIYEAGGGNAGGGAAPVAITLPSNAVSMTFSTTGSVTLNGGTYNDPDGVGAAVNSSSNSGTSTISGISAPNAGYLVGVFVPAGGPTGPAPTALSYGGPTGTAFLTSTTLLDQVFFIGDGRTGDGTGSTQTFYVPTGAATLYLGISDAPGYNGAPGSYGDNGGSFTSTYAFNSAAASTTPEPASYALMGGGFLLVGIRILRRKLG